MGAMGDDSTSTEGDSQEDSSQAAGCVVVEGDNSPACVPVDEGETVSRCRQNGECWRSS